MTDLVTDTMRNFNPTYESYVQPVRADAGQGRVM